MPVLSKVCTIGHGSRPLDEFIELLLSFDVRLVLDVRTIPRSRHNPQFNRETLPGDLKIQKIGYQHLSGLGGLRKPLPDSVNTGWHNSAFQGFADYMQTEAFLSNLNQVIESASRQILALMCAETLPWRCHRSLIADALVIRGIPVTHLFKAGVAEDHRLTPFARVEKTTITYPGPRAE
jgi:uncharacterized protein (DUF488 family)